MLKFTIICTAFVVLFLNVVYAQSGSIEQDLIKGLFSGQYDKRVRPRSSSDKQAPVQVAVNMYLRSVAKIDDVKNEFDVQLTYRQKWKDERLAFKSAGGYLNLINPSDLTWLPDTFFSNEKEGNYHNLMVRNEFVRVSPNGDVLHSARLSMKLSCPMNFQNFPFDAQICSIRFASYGHTNRDVKYIWDESVPVQIAKNLNLPTFSLENMSTENCDSVTNTGTYSCLKVNFKFKRAFSPYLINVYIPCVMMVIVACLSFWIDSQALVARVVLISLTLFTLATQTSELNKTFPTTGYSKAIDIWTGTCLTFVFGALVEFIVVQYLAKEEKAKKSETSVIEDAGDEEDGESKMNKKKAENSGIRKLFYDEDSVSEKIDRASRIVFPACFVVFVFLYCIVYALSPSQDI